MDNIVNLDVLVVYSSGLSVSASVDDAFSMHPFLMNSKQANYNLSYAYFLRYCKRNKLTAGLTTSTDVIGPGLCKSFWTYEKNHWIKNQMHGSSKQIFDKISPITTQKMEQRQLLLSDESISPFNDVELFDTFFDKLRTYKRLPEFAIPTVSVHSSQNSDISQAVIKLKAITKKHIHAKDFTQTVVLKDRFGAGGENVYKIDQDVVNGIQRIMNKHKDVRFILQPFLSFDKGYTYKGHTTSTDIRLIFYKNTLLQSYIRMAKKKDFRCNEHQGGQLVYIHKMDVPKMLHTIANSIVEKIHKSQSLYALDFVISNTGTIYFIEGNIGPGIDWNIKKKINEVKSKQLIQSIVHEFVGRIKHTIVIPITPQIEQYPPQLFT